MRSAHRITFNRKLNMKTFAALSVACCLLGGGPARAEVIDFSKVTCKQFFDTHRTDVGLILAWLYGFSREDNDPPILDTNEFAADAKKFAEYCAGHPDVSLMTAADEIFAD
jgi:acid stress chaperone HdeB